MLETEHTSQKKRDKFKQSFINHLVFLTSSTGTVRRPPTHIYDRTNMQTVISGSDLSRTFHSSCTCLSFWMTGARSVGHESTFRGIGLSCEWEWCLKVLHMRVYNVWLRRVAGLCHIFFPVFTPETLWVTSVTEEKVHSSGLLNKRDGGEECLCFTI